MGLAGESLQPLVVERRRKVEDRAGRTRAAEAVAVAHVARVEGGAMNVKVRAGRAGLGRHRDANTLRG